jgi:fibronectin type 3 domain-containing protein
MKRYPAILLSVAMLIAYAAITLLSPVQANNPGGHAVQLSWSDTCPTGQTCTYNIYKGTATGVCGTGQQPFANTATLNYEDDTVVAGTTYFYAVTQLPSAGGESNCSAQLQEAVPNSSGSTPVVSGQTH